MPQVKCENLLQRYAAGERAFIGFNLTGANLTGVCLSGIYLSRANLSKANLSKANLSKADFRGADLREANLAEADLTEADLRDANLYGALLWRADLRGADLRMANLNATDLTEANLDKAVLTLKEIDNDIIIPTQLTCGNGHYHANANPKDTHACSKCGAPLFAMRLHDGKFWVFIINGYYSFSTQKEAIEACQKLAKLRSD